MTYYQQFKAEVCGPIHRAKQRLDIVTLLAPLCAPVFAEVFMNDHPWRQYFVLAIVVLSGVMAYYSDSWVNWWYHSKSNKKTQQMVEKFQGIVEKRLPYVQDNLRRNFDRKNVKEIRKMDIGMKESSTTTDDEFNIINKIDACLKRLQKDALTLEDLLHFYYVKDIIVVQNAVFLDPMILIQKDICKLGSTIIHKLVIDNNGGCAMRLEIQKTLRDFVAFVLRGDLGDGMGSAFADLAEVTEDYLNGLLNKKNTQPCVTQLTECRIHVWFTVEYTEQGTTYCMQALKLASEKLGYSTFTYQVFDKDDESIDKIVQVAYERGHLKTGFAGKLGDHDEFGDNYQYYIMQSEVQDKVIIMRQNFAIDLKAEIEPIQPREIKNLIAFLKTSYDDSLQCVEHLGHSDAVINLLFEIIDKRKSLRGKLEKAQQKEKSEDGMKSTIREFPKFVQNMKIGQIPYEKPVVDVEPNFEKKVVCSCLMYI